MPTIGRSRRVITLLLRLFIALALLLAVALAILAWWVPRHGEAWLDRTLRARITRIVDDASVEGYHFSMEKLETDLQTQSLVISGVELDFPPALMDSLRSGAVQYLFAASAERIELRGLSFWRLLLKSEFKVQAFELRGPRINYLLGRGKVDLADPFARIGGRGATSIDLLGADTLVVRRAMATVQDLGERLPQLQLVGLDLESRDVRVSTGQRHSGVHVNVGTAELRFESASGQLADGDAIRVDRVQLSLSKRSGRVFNFQHLPQTVSTDTVRRTVLDLRMDSLVLSNLDVDLLISRQVLHLGHATVHGLRVEASLDKTLAPEPPQVKLLPPAALLGIGFPISVDTLSIQKAHATYRERDGETGQWGRAPFSELQGAFLHITNEPEVILEHPRITGHATGLLFEVAPVTLNYSAELDGSQDFKIVADVSDLKLVAINPISRSLLRIQVNGGRLDSMHLTMEGNERKAKGLMKIRYTDLLVRVEPGTPRAVHNSMFGNVIETMLKEAYGGGLTADRERKYSIDRDPDRAITTYLWHAIREGLARNLAPEAWDRMRLMLRVDAKERREQRARRKAQKEAR